MAQSNYTYSMDYFDEFIKQPKNDRWSGSDVHLLLEEVYQDFKVSELKKRSNPKPYIYNRDLLSHLVKTYGH